MSPDPHPSAGHARRLGAADATWKIIAHSRAEDYDGHTEFGLMTPSARLEWLEAALRFIQAAKRDRGHGPDRAPGVG